MEKQGGLIMSKMKQIIELLTEGITYGNVIREINYREDHDKR